MIRTNPEQRGATIVVVALLMTVLLIVAAFVIDVGNAKQERRQAQNAADAAALAGATDIGQGDLNATSVVTLIKSYVASNYGTVAWSTCNDGSALGVQPDPTTSCISWDADPPATAKVRVVVPTRNVATAFGRVINVTSMPVFAAAVATVGKASQVVPAPCALCTLGSSSVQNGSVNVAGGAVYIDGNVDCNPQSGVTTSGSPQPPIDVSGSPMGKCNFNPSSTTAPVIPDPLASLPASPDFGNLVAKPDCNSGTAVPGFYNNISGSCSLSPGLYVVTGIFGGSGSGVNISGHGVTIFFACGSASGPHACSAGESGGTVVIGGSSNVDISACTSTSCAGGAMRGMALWFDRNDTVTASIHGTGNIGFTGTVYGRSVNLDISGTPAAGTGTCAAGGFCSQVVVDSFGFTGQGTLGVTYSQDQNVVVTTAAALSQLLA